MTIYVLISMLSYKRRLNSSANHLRLSISY